MTIATSTGPVPLSRVWSGRQVLAEDLAGEDLADVLELHAGASAWWVLDRNSRYARDELERLAEALDLDHLAVADLTAEDHRAKFEEIGTSRLVMTNAVRLDTERVRLAVYPVSLLITERAVVCLADAGVGHELARLLTAAGDRLAGGGLDSAAQVVVAAMVADYVSVVDWLEEATDGLSDLLFDERSFTREEQLRAFRVRRVLSILRRITDPMVGVTGDLRDNATSGSAVARHWGLLAEKHAHTAHAADAVREELSSAFDTSLALAEMQLNMTIKKLTGWAGIIAVPTLVTGFVGMNVLFPLNGTVLGFVIYLIVMVAAAVVLWAVFRRRDWI